MSLLPRKRWFGAAQMILFVAGIGFFVLSVVALGILPGLRLEKSIHDHAPLTLAPFTPAETRGRITYGTQGCAYCHSEQVRSTPEDVRRWGPPTTPWETKFESPQLWGTRRIGPDLARESGVRSDDWQLTHLYNPRLIVPGSVMPGFAWMFKGSPNQPTDVAKDLLAYMKTLGRARMQAGSAAHDAPNEAMPGMQPDSDASLDANGARAHLASPGRELPRTLSPTGVANRGATLFAQNCAGCHGALGNGASVASASLLPHPTNLTVFRYSEGAFAGILHDGVVGSSMPAWRDLTAQQVADLGAFVSTLHAAAEPATSEPGGVSRGAELYAQNCTACHGVGGGGDGPASLAFKPRPYNFRHLQPDVSEIDRVLRVGVPGTAMLAFPTLSEPDRQALAAYVRSLYGQAAEQGSLKAAAPVNKP
ncbi:cbb3-type cytochrome c oxidase subunit II [Gluconacetobacter entanii]|uniref:cbb3-type cytochrome c oxidase subunit II n=1 Tax=Gluconacetobacter entanii TaxID=108528 RepID=UPI001C934908|nr:cbb3-type cytochrome c oxidase subunit II [Gluconacetobacter entanii]MBY4638682.1 cbb3-type cytochrome c oxidase subunit II [Gluconacetobacter entanii]MCW4579679.1 cbb3-type cytochrome c oxidase subunit II [Gluconacetobacter entanii]MCW4583084.1 cbb3-type cytochrome c oxidase subunit II [Gluconacetobacter entanii]MCW4586480.1 cbb3-type cytochrome c oxidase subunit II [Gluconacetobacter entanii]